MSFSHLKKKKTFTCHPRTKRERADTRACVFVCAVSYFTQACEAVQGLPYLCRVFSFFFFGLWNLLWQVATLHQGWRLPDYQRCISWPDKALALLPAQQHPIINKSSRKEAFVTVYLDGFSSSPLISSSENWCTLRLKQWVWQVMVSVITAQISSAMAFFFLCVQLLELSARLPVIQCIR